MIGNLLTSLFITFCIGIGTYQADRLSRDQTDNLYNNPLVYRDKSYVNYDGGLQFDYLVNGDLDLYAYGEPTYSVGLHCLNFTNDSTIDDYSLDLSSVQTPYGSVVDYISSVSSIVDDYDCGYIWTFVRRTIGGTTRTIYRYLPFLKIQSFEFNDARYTTNAIEFYYFGNADDSQSSWYSLVDFSSYTITQDFSYEDGVVIPFDNPIASNFNNFYSNYICWSSYYFETYYTNSLTYHPYMCMGRVLVNYNINNASYTNGYTNGYTEGVADGYQNGYREGLATSHNASFIGLMNSIADTPLRFLYGLFNFDLFGTSVLIIIMSLLTGIIVFGVVKKFWR